MIQDTSAQDHVIKAQLPRIKQAKWALAIIAALSGVAMAYPSLQQWQNNEIAIKGDKLRFAKVTRGTFVRDISASGKIVAAHAPSVYSTVPGNVELLVQAGDTVNVGQVVAKLTSPELSNALKQQQSVLASLTMALERQKLNVRSEALTQQQTLDMAEVALKAAKREQRRATVSIKQQLISQIDFEKAQDDLSRAELAFNHASQEAALKKDQLAFEVKSKALDLNRQQLVVDELMRQVSELNIKAPVEGVIGNLLVEQRSQVSTNQPLLTVVDLTAYEAELMVPENFADDIGLEMQTQISVNGVLISGRISSISPEVNNSQVITRVRFDSQDHAGLRQNQRVNARVLLDNKPNVLMVKRGAFLQSGGGKFAYVVNQNSASKIAISVGASSISQVEITAGVKEGDQLVISALDNFKQAKQVLIR